MLSLSNIIIACSCIFLYGIAHSSLIPLSRNANIPKFAISFVYGLSLLVVNLFAIYYTNNFKAFHLLLQPVNFVPLFGYIIPNVIANFVNLVGIQYSGTDAGIFSLIVSIFPVLTILINSIIFEGFKVSYMYLFIGTIFYILGAYFISLGKL